MQVKTMTELMLASKKGNISEVKKLLKNGANVHDVIQDEPLIYKSALTYASENGYADIVFILICSGALNLDDLDEFDKHEVLIAISYSLLRAIRYGHYDVCDILLKFKVSPNMTTVDMEDVSALHIAVYRNRISIINLLLKYNVNLDVEDWTRRTPLMTAIQEKNSYVVNLLLEAGADPNIDRYGVIYGLIFERDLNTLKLLMKYGLKIENISTDEFDLKVQNEIKDVIKVLQTSTI